MKHQGCACLPLRVFIRSGPDFSALSDCRGNKQLQQWPCTHRKAPGAPASPWRYNGERGTAGMFFTTAQGKHEHFNKCQAQTCFPSVPRDNEHPTAPFINAFLQLPLKSLIQTLRQQNLQFLSTFAVHKHPKLVEGPMNYPFCAHTLHSSIHSLYERSYMQ